MSVLLKLMTDDIAHIEGQNRGLQVQTSNQRMLLAELDKLMVSGVIDTELLLHLKRCARYSQRSISPRQTSRLCHRNLWRVRKASSDSRKLR